MIIIPLILIDRLSGECLKVPIDYTFDYLFSLLLLFKLVSSNSYFIFIRVPDTPNEPDVDMLNEDHELKMIPLEDVSVLAVWILYYFVCNIAVAVIFNNLI